MKFNSNTFFIFLDGHLDVSPANSEANQQYTDLMSLKPAELGSTYQQQQHSRYTRVPTLETFGGDRTDVGGLQLPPPPPM